MIVRLYSSRAHYRADLGSATDKNASSVGPNPPPRAGEGRGGGRRSDVYDSVLSYPAAVRSNSCGRLNISLRPAHSSGYIDCSNSWLAAARKYPNPAAPTVPV